MNYILKSTFFFVIFIFIQLISFSQATDCELIDYVQKNTIDGNKLIIRETKVLQINKRMGDKYATIQIPYSKKTKVTIENAQIEDISGNVIRVLKKSEIKDISDISDFSLFEDNYIKEFELKHNTYPYRIRYTVRYVLNEFLEIADWYPCIDNEVPTRNALLEIRIPLNYPIKYTSYKIDNPKTDTIENNIRYIFYAKDIKLPKKEFFSPPIEFFTPFVKVIPKTFTWIYPGSHESWKDYGNWIFNLLQGTENLPENDKENVKKLIHGKTNKYDVVKTLYYYLQNKTRYINVSVGVGGLKPYSAEYVSQNGYGDCKALSVYMIALLKEAGIKAYYTTIYAGEEYPKFLPDFVCHQSNHIITCVPIDNDTMFLECTNNSIPAGYVGVSTQGRQALIVDNNNSKLIHTPILKMSDVRENRIFHFHIQPDNVTLLSISNIFRGNSFEYFNWLNSGNSISDAEIKIREKFFKGLPNFELITWNNNRPYKDSALINFNANLKIENYLKNYGIDYGLSIPNLGLPVVEPPSLRKLPVWFDYPVYYSDSIYYDLPENYTVKLKIAPSYIQSQYGHYIFIPKFEEHKIILFREFILNRGEYPLDLYPGFYQFISEITKSEKSLILLSKSL